MTAPAWLDSNGARLWSRLETIIAAGPDAPIDSAERDGLALELLAWQRSRCIAVDRAMRAMGAPDRVESIDRVQGLPTDAFKTARIACFDPAEETRVFLTSGTTREVRGRHPFASLDLYRAAALASAACDLLPDPPYRFVLLAECEADAPHSSLSYMLARITEQFGIAWGAGDAHGPWMIADGSIDAAKATKTIEHARARGERVALLGATFGFVHLIDALARPQPLPPGSVVMPTGGFKGRSRELAPDELFAEIGRSFSVSRAAIVQEYGMTELSSQAYERHGAGEPFGRYASPAWMIVTAMDPTTLAPLPDGETGLLRVIDLVNVGSCIAIQTADLGTTHGRSFEVFGRAPGATPRGCARAIDALLSGSE